MEDWPQFVAQEDVVHDENSPLLYSVDDDPPLVLSIFLGIQQFLTAIGSVLFVTLTLGHALCILPHDPALGYLASTLFMVSGISTILQATLGIRLPVIQGPSFAYLSCILSLLNLWTCPSRIDLYSMGAENRTVEWQSRLQEIQGAVISVAVIQIVLGFSGVFGFILKHISPLTIASTISLVGLTMMNEAMRMASGNWYLALATIVIVVIFSQILRNLKTPMPWYTLSRGWCVMWLKGFQLFPIILGTYLVCLVYFLLTHFGAFAEDVSLKTELSVDWFRVPYPFQWGWPRFTGTSIAAVIPATIVGILESISNYYACASICGKSPPDLSAVNRGTGTEGISSLIAGMFGSGPGMSSYTENIGTIGITLVGSRRVIVCGSVIMIILSMVGPLGFPFAIIPIPLIGGILCVMFAMVTAVGLSHLQYVNLSSHRNMFVLGSSIFFGIAIPIWLEHHRVDFLTGYFGLDQLLQILLSNHIFIAAFTAFLLDSSVPGADREMKRFPWHETGSQSWKKTYDFPKVFPFKF